MIQKQEKNLALKTHLTVDIIEKIIPIDLHDFFVVLNIRVDPQDVNFISRILWEFVIKTYTCEKKTVAINKNSVVRPEPMTMPEPLSLNKHLPMAYVILLDQDHSAPNQ